MRWTRELLKLPRAMPNSSGKAVIYDQLMQLGHKLDKVLPVKQVARKIINR